MKTIKSLYESMPTIKELDRVYEITEELMWDDFSTHEEKDALEHERWALNDKLLSWCGDVEETDTLPFLIPTKPTRGPRRAARRWRHVIRRYDTILRPR